MTFAGDGVPITDLQFEYARVPEMLMAINLSVYAQRIKAIFEFLGEYYVYPETDPSARRLLDGMYKDNVAPPGFPYVPADALYSLSKCACGIMTNTLLGSRVLIADLPVYS